MSAVIFLPTKDKIFKCIFRITNKNRCFVKFITTCHDKSSFSRIVTRTQISLFCISIQLLIIISFKIKFDWLFLLNTVLIGQFNFTKKFLSNTLKRSELPETPHIQNQLLKKSVTMASSSKSRSETPPPSSSQNQNGKLIFFFVVIQMHSLS